MAVAEDVFHCIILKGGDQYPYFPRPLLTQFDFTIPISSTTRKKPTGEDGDEEMDESTSHNTNSKLQESFVRANLEVSLLEDSALAGEINSAQASERQRMNVEIDKTILQMLAGECREGEEKGMKAYELVTLFRDRTGKMLEAASKIAQRYSRGILDEKIRDLAERRLADEDDEYDDYEVL